MQFSDDFFKLSGKKDLFLTPIMERKESNCDQYGKPIRESVVVKDKTIEENDESLLFDRLCLSPETIENKHDEINDKDINS